MLSVELTLSDIEAALLEAPSSLSQAIRSVQTHVLNTGKSSDRESWGFWGAKTTSCINRHGIPNGISGGLAAKLRCHDGYNDSVPAITTHRRRLRTVIGPNHCLQHTRPVTQSQHGTIRKALGLDARSSDMRTAVIRRFAGSVFHRPALATILAMDCARELSAYCHGGVASGGRWLR